MRDDEKLEITAGQIRKLAEKYEGVKEVFPEAFEEEMEDITDRVIMSWDKHGRGWDIHFQDPDRNMMVGYLGQGGEILGQVQAFYKIVSWDAGIDEKMFRILRRKTCPK